VEPFWRARRRQRVVDGWPTYPEQLVARLIAYGSSPRLVRRRAAIRARERLRLPIRAKACAIPHDWVLEVGRNLHRGRKPGRRPLPCCHEFEEGRPQGQARCGNRASRNAPAPNASEVTNDAAESRTSPCQASGLRARARGARRSYSGARPRAWRPPQTSARAA
jgi:hypothetical protein